MPVQQEQIASQGSTKTASSQMAQTGSETLPVVVSQVASKRTAVPKSKIRWWMGVVGGLLVVGLAGLFYFQPWATPVPVVRVETVTPGPVTRVLAVNGRIAGLRSVEVRPLVSGTLLEVSVAEGDAVTRDMALMQLDAGCGAAGGGGAGCSICGAGRCGGGTGPDSHTGCQCGPRGAGSCDKGRTDSGARGGADDRAS